MSVTAHVVVMDVPEALRSIRKTENDNDRVNYETREITRKTEYGKGTKGGKRQRQEDYEIREITRKTEYGKGAKRDGKGAKEGKRQRQGELRNTRKTKNGDGMKKYVKGTEDGIRQQQGTWKIHG